MFAKGDRIVYSFYGICLVAGIVEKVVNGENRKYYELRPLADSKSIIYTPIDSKKVLLRSIVSKEEAQDILDSMDEMEIVWPENVWKRNQEFKLITQNADLRLNVNLYKVLLLRQLQLKEAGKKMIVQDIKILDTVGTLVCAEIEEALGLETKEIESQVEATAKKCLELVSEND